MNIGPWIGGIAGVAYFLAAFHGRPPLRTELVSRAMGALLLGALIRLIIWAITRSRPWWRRQSERERAFYREWAIQSGRAMAVLGVWLLGQWPGIMSIDVFQAYRKIQNGIFHGWSSWIYSAFLMMFGQFWGNPGLVTLCQAIAIAIGIGLILSRAVYYGVPKSATRIALLLFLAIPLNPAMSVFLNRDVPFSWMQIAIACIIPFEAFEKPPVSWRRILGYASFCAAFGTLRTEALVELPFLPLFLLGIAGWTWRQVSAFSTALLLLVGLLYWGVPAYTGTYGAGTPYVLTAMLNPLAEIVREPHATGDPKADAAIIDRVINYKMLVTLDDPFEIPAFHQGGMRQYTNEDFERFKALYRRLVLRNPGLYLKNRTRIFLATHGITTPTFYISDDLGSQAPSSREGWRKLGVEKAPASRALMNIENCFLWSSLDESAPWHIPLLSTALPLLLALGALVLFRRAPASASAAFLVLVRIAAVSLTSPASQFKYVYGLYLMAFVLPFMLYVELKKSPRRAP